MGSGPLAKEMTTPGFEEVDEERLLAGGNQSSEFSNESECEFCNLS